MTSLGFVAPDGGARGPRLAAPAAAAHRRRSPSASPRWSRSTRSPRICATRCGGRPRRCSAPTSRWRAGSRCPRRRAADRHPGGARRAGGAASPTSPRWRYVPRTDGTRLVQVAAIEGGYPFYGEIRTDPERRLVRACSAAATRWWIPSLLAALRARVGDTLALGEARFVISGTVASAPGNVGLRAAFGPRVFIPARYLEETRLLGFGARAEYEAYLRLPAGISAAGRSPRRTGPTLRGERVRVRTVADDRERLNETLSRLTGYLGLVALIALLLGGIGVASAVVVFIRQRMDTIAVLRCLGATGRRVFARLRRGGGRHGARRQPGRCARRRRVPAGACPGCSRICCRWTSRPRVSWRAIALGVGMGLWVALGVRALPAARRSGGCRRSRRCGATTRPSRGRAILALGGRRWRWRPAPSRLAALQVGSWRQGAIFAGGVAVALLVLWVASWALVRARSPLASRRAALPLAPGPLQPAPPVEPDGHRRAGDRLRRLPARDALPGAAQPAAAAPAHRRARPAQPGAVRHPARSALRGAARAARGGPLGAATGADRADADRVGEGAAGAGHPDRHQRGRGPPAPGPSAGSIARPTATRWSASERLVGGHVVEAARRRQGRTAARRRHLDRDRSRARSSASVSATRSCGTCRGSRSRPGSPACARWTGPGSSRTSSSCSSPGRWTGRRTRW